MVECWNDVSASPRELWGKGRFPCLLRAKVKATSVSTSPRIDHLFLCVSTLKDSGYHKDLLDSPINHTRHKLPDMPQRHPRTPQPHEFPQQAQRLRRLRVHGATHRAKPFRHRGRAEIPREHVETEKLAGDVFDVAHERRGDDRGARDVAPNHDVVQGLVFGSERQLPGAFEVSDDLAAAMQGGLVEGVEIDEGESDGVGGGLCLHSCRVVEDLEKALWTGISRVSHPLNPEGIRDSLKPRSRTPNVHEP